jgi:uncharacterized membrane protein
MLAIWLAGASAAQDLPALYDVTGVAAGDVLNIRAEPDAGAAILGGLAPDARGVEVVAIADGWAQVNSGEASGHVALRFLTPQPGPAWHALERPLTCFGTEPFWSLKIDPAAGEAILSRPATNDVTYATGKAYPGSAAFPVAGLPLTGGRIVLLAARACSDGMSDRMFGIGASFHPPGFDSVPLTGCCSLGFSAP